MRHFTKEHDKTSGDDYLDINEDVAGHIWFATDNGTLMYVDRNGKFVKINNGKAIFSAVNGGRIREICNAADGSVVLSTNSGLFTFSPWFRRAADIRITSSKYSLEDTASLMTRDVITTLCCRRQNYVYVATMGGGIQRMSTEKHSFAKPHFQMLADGMSDNDVGSVRGMFEDSHGLVWVVGEQNIRSYDYRSGNCRVYTTEHWGRNVAFCEMRPCCSPNTQSVMLGCYGGLLLFHPADLRKASFNPSIVFSGILYQGEESVTPIFGDHEIILPVDKHGALVFFSALDYSNNSQIRYAYRIKELSDQWVFVGKEHYASLSNMPPGHHTLEVRSTNSDGTWIGNNAELSIYVVPTFWQTSWAYVLYFLIGGMLLYGIVYVFQLRHAHKLEKRLKERQLRFFTGISHQLRTPLTLIDGPVQEALNTEKLSEKATTYLKYVKNNASKMLALVNRSLDINRLQELDEDVASGKGDAGEPVDIATSRLDLSVTDNLTILVVEDNPELRSFLATALAEHYNIIAAENGRVGLRLAAERQPDFIITDIMMPEMDGITMIRSIKRNQNISHIPIIILSARTADVYRIEGLKEGADDYITKPFSVSYLQVRVESIVRQRQLLQEQWRSRLAPSEETPAAVSDETSLSATSTNGLTSIDERFTESFSKFVKENYTNENLNNQEIASALGISRSVLYGKVKSIYGSTPNDIVRNIRLAQSYKMIKSDMDMNIGEIAYAVGFTDPKYFSRIFKQTYGVTPTEFRKSVQAAV